MLLTHFIQIGDTVFRATVPRAGPKWILEGPGAGRKNDPTVRGVEPLQWPMRPVGADAWPDAPPLEQRLQHQCSRWALYRPQRPSGGHGQRAGPQQCHRCYGRRAWCGGDASKSAEAARYHFLLPERTRTSHGCHEHAAAGHFLGRGGRRRGDRTRR